MSPGNMFILKTFVGDFYCQKDEIGQNFYYLMIFPMCARHTICEYMTLFGAGCFKEIINYSQICAVYDNMDIKWKLLQELFPMLQHCSQDGGSRLHELFFFLLCPSVGVLVRTLYQYH